MDDFFHAPEKKLGNGSNFPTPNFESMYLLVKTWMIFYLAMSVYWRVNNFHLGLTILIEHGGFFNRQVSFQKSFCHPKS